MKRTSWSSGLSVTADGSGVVAHAGSVALRLLADRTGLTGELSKAMARSSFLPVHDRGRVLTDVAVMLVDATVWPRIAGGCHTGRDTAAAITASGFTLDNVEHVRFPDIRLPLPTSSHILGTARAQPAQS